MDRLRYRRATAADVGTIVEMLADDVLGSSRESVSPSGIERYHEAFAEIDADRNQFLCVVEDGQQIVGTLQLTFIPGLARNGAKRGQIEAVRIASDRRGENIGQAMFAWAIDECRARGCSLVQLTTDKARPDAHRFYERLGFEPTHIGYKLKV
ncbi:GNAT family N-acetyltransferase (plasmid) [Rhizobium sp. TRM96647]|uniref:GNAT family N-acetyltransferase n=1 Tax=unclassified Rhizobium TaxID=2613769 RepID=UPI0021E75BBF|nr:MULTISPECIES: GNAT family N-acetyltransferase [unclassified Rhizobium]MCV3735412.1 GNAT family N-acetyltransferase [Rhizobium sp. TRM96647]MCV3757825.1 GNAT family N-acetyltransferase [Rhizobium sp. TRM96650]